MKGQRVCKMHGGKKPAAVANAEKREATTQADGVVRRLLLDPQSQPVTDPVLALQRLAGGLQGMVDELGRRVHDLPIEVDDSPQQLRAEVLLLERLIGHLRGLLVDMARLGLEDRVTAVLEAQGEQVAEIVRAIGSAVLRDLVRLLAEHPAALAVVEAGYQEALDRAAYAELSARHAGEIGQAS